ncbi:SDR family NAD(P)-dependent oxidoreductase [Streptomyces sp. NPDC055681]
MAGEANGIGLPGGRFLEEGMKVVIADIDRDDLTRTERALAELGEVLAVPTDVADANSVQSLADTAVERFGAVHVLCNNAGVGGAQRFSTTGLPTWRWILGVNLWGVIHGCHFFLPILAAREQAYIVNTASM